VYRGNLQVVFSCILYFFYENFYFVTQCIHVLLSQTWSLIGCCILTWRGCIIMTSNTHHDHHWTLSKGLPVTVAASLLWIAGRYWSLRSDSATQCDQRILHQIVANLFSCVKLHECQYQLIKSIKYTETIENQGLEALIGIHDVAKFTEIWIRYISTWFPNNSWNSELDCRLCCMI